MLPQTPQYLPPNPVLWQGRMDSLPHERFFQQVQCVDARNTVLPQTPSQIMLGFCSDEGIRRNLGRVGAKAGPDQIRTMLGKLAYHAANTIIDIGNISCDNHDLESAQQAFAEWIAYCHQQGHTTLALGGGHEIAWAHFSGLTKQYPKLGIINIDAHFDLRPLQNNLGNSGTPFFQIATFCQENNRPFHYACLGIQPVANTKSLFQQAHVLKVPYLTAEQLQTESLAWHIAFLDDFLSQHEHIYLSICLDVFAEAFAPGVSAPQALGLNPKATLPLLKYITQTGKVVGLDIAEFSPPWDQADKTARLAATMLAELLGSTPKLPTTRPNLNL